MQKVGCEQKACDGYLDKSRPQFVFLSSSMIGRLSSSILIEYIKRGDLESIKSCLKHGYKVYVPSYQGEMPLNWAIKIYNSEVLLLMLEHLENVVIFRDECSVYEFVEFVDQMVEGEIRKARTCLMGRRDKILNNDYQEKEKEKIKKYDELEKKALGEDLKKLSPSQKKMFHQVVEATKKPDVCELLKARQQLISELFYLFICGANFSNVSLFVMMQNYGSEAFKCNGKGALYRFMEFQIRHVCDVYSLGSLDYFAKSLLEYDIDNALSSFDGNDFKRLLNIAKFVDCTVKGVYGSVEIMIKLIPVYVAIRRGDDVSGNLMSLDVNDFDTFPGNEYIHSLRKLMKCLLTLESYVGIISSSHTYEIFRKIIGEERAEKIMLEPQVTSVTATFQRIEAMISSSVLNLDMIPGTRFASVKATSQLVEGMGSCCMLNLDMISGKRFASVKATSQLAEGMSQSSMLNFGYDSPDTRFAAVTAEPTACNEEDNLMNL